MFEKLEYPRILLVTSSTFNPFTGTGVLLSNLFKGWPIDKMAMIHSDNFYHDSALCPIYYKLGDGEFSWRCPFSIFKKHYMGYDSGKSHTKYDNPQKLSQRNISVQKYRNIYNIVNSILGGEEVYIKRIISRNLLQWINNFKPDIIYSHISTLNNILFVQELSDKLQIPLCIHIMDDWLTVRYRTGLFAPILRFRYLNEFRKLLKHASLRMGIGKKMCEIYEKRYGYPFMPFSNVVDSFLWLKHRFNRSGDNNKFTILYAGIIDSKNIENLESMAKIVKSLYCQGMNILFKINTFQPLLDAYRSKFENKPSVIMEEAPNHNERFISLLMDADLLFLPVDFTKVSREPMRYSMFAKIPAYMMSGTPVLVYGPPEVAAVEYAIKEEWAYVVPQKNEKALKDAILRLSSDATLREKLGRKAQQLAIRDFDANKVRKEFHMALVRTAHK